MGTSNTECYGQIQGHGSRRAPVVFYLNKIILFSVSRLPFHGLYHICTKTAGLTFSRVGAVDRSESANAALFTSLSRLPPFKYRCKFRSGWDTRSDTIFLNSPDPNILDTDLPSWEIPGPLEV